jgi:membrane-associated phospholipid phosphatase
MKKILLIILNFYCVSYSQNADIDILKNITQNRNTDLDNTFKGISISLYPLSIGIPLGLGAGGVLQKNTRNEHSSLQIAASIGLTEIAALSLKYSINRPRPFVTYPSIPHCVTETSPSFPSGHSSIAFSLATSLSLAYPKWFVIAPAYLWATSVSYSRLHLGLHYPTDVLAGAVIGVACALLTGITSEKLLHWK